MRKMEMTMSNITLNTKSYTGTSGLLNGVASWVERSLGLAALFSRVRSSIRLGDKSRVKWTLDQPYPQPEGAPVCCAPGEERDSSTTISTRLHPSLTTAERTDHADRLKDLVNSAQFRASIIQLEQQT